MPTTTVKQRNPSDSAYRNAIQDVARKAGHRLTDVKIVHPDSGASYGVAYDASGYPWKVKLNAKSVARFGAWTPMRKNPTGIKNPATPFSKRAIGERFHTGKDKKYFIYQKTDKSHAKVVESVGFGHDRAVGDVKPFSSQEPTWDDKSKNPSPTARAAVGTKNPRELGKKFYYVDPPAGMSEAAIRAYNDVARGMTSNQFYFGKRKHLVGDYDQYWETSHNKYPGRLFRLKRKNSDAVVNPDKPTAKAAVALKRKVKEFTGGMPEDQLTNAELALIKRYPATFENDGGYIKIKRRRRNGSSDDLVKEFTVGNMVFKIYKLDTKRGKPYFMEARHRTEKWVEDIGYFESVNAAEKKALRYKENGHPVRNDGAREFKAFQKKRLADLSKMFQGAASGERVRVLEPDAAPKNKYRLGHLVLIKIRNNGKGDSIEFDGESYLSGDLRNNLWVTGKDARITNIPKPRKGQLKYLGELVQIDYVTAKKHIEGGQLVRFWHPLGEVDKEYPKLYMDHDGFPIIIGGGYDVWDVGIVN